MPPDASSESPPPSGRALSPPGTSTPQAPTPEVRIFTHAGVTWTVTERDGPGVPGNADGARGARCLVFASSEVVRRVWDYPADWRALSDVELLALSWRR